MSDSSSARRDVVFGAASRADDFVEEDTLHTPPQPTRPRRSQAGSGPQPIPPMPSSPAEAAVSEAEPEAEDPAPTEPAPTSSVVPAVVESAAPEQPQAQPFGGSGGGAAFTPRPATPEKATTGFRGLLAKVGVPVGPSEAEKAENERAARRSANETIVRQATWTRAVSVLIANPKGGTGKTPASLLLGGTFASIRGGSVAVVETSDDPGALTYRAEGNPALGLGELVANVDSVTTAGQLAGYTAPQTSFAAVIGSTGRRARLDGDAVVKVAAKVDEFYGIRVMDSGNVPTSGAFRGAVSVSDALVIPVMNAGDSTLEAIALLDELRADGGHAAELADNAIALRMLDGRPENAQVSQEVERVLLEAGVETLLTIPFDPHIAERGQLTLASLNQSTRDAFAQAAATVVRSIQSAVNAGYHQKD